MSDNGSEALDFTYIEDLVDGITKCIGNKNTFNQIFNHLWKRLFCSRNG